MKKSTTIGAIVFLGIIIGIVGLYAFLSGKSRDRNMDVSMTEVQRVLSRDLQNNYPPTVKEVVKFFAEIQKCIYNEECTEEDIEQLGRKTRELYDAELLEANSEADNLLLLKAEVAAFREEERKILSATVASSANVDTFSQDGYEFARIYCTYTVMEKGKSGMERMVYLLRRDENRRWKIYGWDRAENVSLEEN
ncbi:MAG: hypothetical protein HFH91_17150 [Lachnospiraceae bacterium]|jgi:hypothetical protein|nr:hypothetical protein [Lachnospiraceae bacterium]